MTEAEQRLWDATKTGHYPPGTTAQNLANVKDSTTRSALHNAATYGHYPPSTTAQDLADAKDITGRSALHKAAASGHYPPGTTAQHLADAKDNYGYTALHTAAWRGPLPPDTTIALLKTTKDNEGSSAWDYLCNYLRNNPTSTLELPPHLFQEDTQLAITTIQTAIKRSPSLQSQAAIWLGKILAGNQTQHQTPPTH